MHVHLPLSRVSKQIKSTTQFEKYLIFKKPKVPVVEKTSLNANQQKAEFQ